MVVFSVIQMHTQLLDTHIYVVLASSVCYHQNVNLFLTKCLLPIWLSVSPSSLTHIHTNTKELFSNQISLFCFPDVGFLSLLPKFNNTRDLLNQLHPHTEDSRGNMVHMRQDVHNGSIWHWKDKTLIKFNNYCVCCFLSNKSIPWSSVCVEMLL